MNFGAPVKSLTTNDIEVIRLVEAGSAVYEYPQVVKSVKLADNGLSATVELFSNFQNNVNYVIKANGFDDYRSEEHTSELQSRRELSYAR